MNEENVGEFNSEPQTLAQNTKKGITTYERPMHIMRPHGGFGDSNDGENLQSVHS